MFVQTKNSMFQKMVMFEAMYSYSTNQPLRIIQNQEKDNIINASQLIKMAIGIKLPMV